MVKSNIQKSKENLENARDLLKESKKKHNRDDKKVKRQEKVKNNKEYQRKKFLEIFTAKKLYRWCQNIEHYIKFSLLFVIECIRL